MLGAEAHVSVGRQVEHEFAALHGDGQRFFVQDVSFYQTKPRRRPSLL